MSYLQRSNLPPIVTHNVINDATDPVLEAFRRCHLFNHSEDKVKVSIAVELKLAINYNYTTQKNLMTITTILTY